MNFLAIKSCCCCISLKTSGVIIGMIEIGFYVLNLISMHEYEHTEPDFEIHIEKDDIGWVLLDYIFSTVGIVSSALWLYGIFKERPLWMIPGIIASIILIVVINILVFLAWFYHPSPHPKSAALFLSTLAITAILFYFWIVRFSLYTSMRKTMSERSEERERSAFNTLHAI